MSRITQETGFLSDLLARVRAGRLVPAAFQRPYRWTPEDVEEFWGSVADACPVGLFLIWKPPAGLPIAPLARPRLGPITVDLDRGPALILDGQNRLATYAWSMLRPDDPRPDPAAVSPQERAAWYGERVLTADSRARRVGFVARAEAEGLQHYPPGIVGDIPLLNRTMRARLAAGADIDDPGFDWLDRLGEKLRTTRTVITTLEEATPEEAFRQFRRINRAGVPMSDADLARTLGLAETMLQSLTATGERPCVSSPTPTTSTTAPRPTGRTGT